MAEGSVDDLLQLSPDGRRLIISHPCAVVDPAGFRLRNHRQPIFQAQHIGNFVNRKGGPPEVSEFPGAVYGSRVEHDMRMNVMFVNVGADDKSVFPLGQ